MHSIPPHSEALANLLLLYVVVQAILCYGKGTWPAGMIQDRGQPFEAEVRLNNI
jgi:hypothetical protein